jgi:MFS family permease
MTLSFFYGWLIVAITMVAGFLAAGVSNITMAVVLKPISEDLGWSRTLTAAAITLVACLGGLLSPLFGPIADRLGPRLLLPAGGALVGLLAFGVSLSTEPWQFYVTFVPARALTEFLLCGMIAFTTAANWFYLKRPRVMGLVALSTPLESAVLSLVYQFLSSRTSRNIDPEVLRIFHFFSRCKSTKGLSVCFRGVSIEFRLR